MLLSLDKVKERRRQNLFSIEGLKELLLAYEAGYQLVSVFYNEEIISESSLINYGFQTEQLLSVSKNVFEKIAYRESTGGVVGIAKMQRPELSQVKLKNNPLLLILQAVEKPGNLGAVLRTADAAGIDAVICCDPQTDFYNPNVIRSSVGCVFTTQIATAPSDVTISWLQEKGITIFCTNLEGSTSYTEVNYNQPCAIVLGSEANGLTELWVKNADQNIIIPMKGKIDSMNVSVSAAITVFEAVRQRATKIPGAF